MQTNLNLNVEIQKINDVSTKNNNLQQNSKPVETDNKFNDYLQKEKNISSSADKDTTTVAKDNNKSTTDNEVEDVKEVDEKVKNLSKDDILQCLAALVEALKQANSAKETNVSMDQKVDIVNKLNSSISNSLMNALNLNSNLANNVSANNTNTASDVDPTSIINNLLQLLDMNNAGELLDKKSLTTAQSLLNQLGLKIDANNSNISNGTNLDNKSFLQDLIGQVKDEVKSLLNLESKKEVVSSDNLNKLIIPKDNSKVNTEGTSNVSDKADIVVDKSSAYEKSSDSSGYESKKDSNSNLSKDDKILKSILGENSKDTLKVPVFTTNTVSNGNAEAIKEVQVINRDTMATDVIKSVKFMTSNDMKEMIVKVNPGNLGEITIKLIEQDGNMKLNIKASAKETYNLLSQQTAEIKNHLSNQNIKIQEVNIGVYDDDTTFFKDGQFQDNFSQGEHRKNNKQTSNARENYGEDESAEAELDEMSNINMLA